jgi:outer membrane protein
MKKIFVPFLAFLIIAGTFSPSFAQDSPIAIENMPNVIGVAVGALPDYVGSKYYTFGAAPFARITLPNSERYFLLNATELYFNVLNHPQLRFGPVLNYRFGRDNVDQANVNNMRKIDGTIEAGAFLGFEYKLGGNMRHRFIADVEALADVGGEYKGVNGTLSVRYWRPFGRMFDAVIGVGFQYVDNKYTNKYFGVNYVDSLLSGLPYYQAGGGLNNFKIYPGVVMHLSEHWHLAGGFRYQRMTGYAKGSPVVDFVGCPDQWVVGLGTAYSW